MLQFQYNLDISRLEYSSNKTKRYGGTHFGNPFDLSAVKAFVKT